VNPPRTAVSILKVIDRPIRRTSQSRLCCTASLPSEHRSLVVQLSAQLDVTEKHGLKEKSERQNLRKCQNSASSFGDGAVVFPHLRARSASRHRTRERALSVHCCRWFRAGYRRSHSRISSSATSWTLYQIFVEYESEAVIKATGRLYIHNTRAEWLLMNTERSS
jgi:hypothetical protein